MTIPLLKHLNRGFGRISRIDADYPALSRTTVFAALLLFTFIAPACAPNEPLPEREPPLNLVLLTDTTRWEPGTLRTYTNNLAIAGYRVLVSGFPGESAAELTARLPWLLQPGVDLFMYDDVLAGEAGMDSLRNYLDRTDHPAKIERINR